MDSPPATATPTAPTTIRPSPGRLHKMAALGTVTATLLAGLVMTPLSSTSLPAMPALLTAYAAAMLLINLLLAALLYGRGSTEQRAGTIQLGSAFLFVGLIFVPLLLSFPEKLMPGVLIGGLASPLWLWAIWHVGFALAVTRYAFTRWRGAAPGGVMREAVITSAIVLVLALLTINGMPGMPALVVDGRTLFGPGLQAIPLGILAVNLLALGALAALWRRAGCGVELLWLGVAMVAACVDVWLNYQGGERFSLGWYASKLCSLVTSLAVLVSLFAELNLLYRRVTQAHAALASQTHQDGATGLTNRRRFDELLAAEWTRAFRAQRPMALLMIDIDDLKRFNQRYSYAAGDESLRRVAQLTRACTRRAGDMTARYDGGQFAAILPDTDLAGASAMAELLRSELEALAIAHADAPGGVLTVSIGIALTQARQTSPSNLLDAAQAALVAAKRLGHGQISVAPQVDESGTPQAWSDAEAAGAPSA